MGGDPVDRRQDWLLGRDPQELGAPVRAGIRACALGRPRTSASGSRLWSARSVNCAKPTRSCARPARISPWRSSTAGRGHDRVHRRPSGRLRGRADLQGAADRPVHLPRPCRPARRPRPAAGAGSKRRDADESDPARARGELRRLRRAQGLAATRPRGDRGRPLHGGAADADHGLGGGGARTGGPHHHPRSGGGLPP
jgi:hypothetical protein